MPHNRATHCPLCGGRLTPLAREGRDRPTCVECGFVYFFNPASAAAGLVIREPQCEALLIRRRIAPHAGDWALPAGYQEINERPEATARREVLEETGLEVRIDRLLEVVWVGDDARKPANVFIYLCTPAGGELLAASDAQDAAWFSLENLPEAMGFGNRALVTRILSELKHG